MPRPPRGHARMKRREQSAGPAPEDIYLTTPARDGGDGRGRRGIAKGPDLDLTTESTAIPELRLSRVCAKCGQENNAARRHKVLTLVNLFGIGGGWRLCDCKQSLLKGWGP